MEFSIQRYFSNGTIQSEWYISFPVSITPAMRSAGLKEETIYFVEVKPIFSQFMFPHDSMHVPELREVSQIIGKLIKWASLPETPQLPESKLAQQYFWETKIFQFDFCCFKCNYSTYIEVGVRPLRYTKPIGNLALIAQMYSKDKKMLFWSQEIWVFMK